MRHAVLSDIHANADALDAVLRDVEAMAVTSLVLLGDYVGYYYDPKAVIDRLMRWPHAAIAGNHDRMLLAARDSQTVLTNYRARYGHGLDVALDTLDARNWAWLEGLPERATIELGGHVIELCHGSPFDRDAYVYPDAPALIARCGVADREAVWLGHTHWPFMRPGAPWLLNPGSVGQSRDLGGIASWCTYDDESQAIAFRRTEYDTSRLHAQIATRDSDLVRNLAVLTKARIAREKST